MARQRFRPSTRSRQFNPLQLSNQGVTEMRREHERMIEGLRRNFAAEKEQQERDRKAMQENAALEEQAIKRNREIEIDNLEREQTAISKQESVDKQQAKYDAEAGEAIFDSLADFSNTLSKKSAARTAKMIVDQQKEAEARPYLHLVDKVVDAYRTSEQSLIEAGITIDADAIEDSIETGKPQHKTFQDLVGNPALGDVQDKYIQNKVAKAAWSRVLTEVKGSTEAVFTDKDGNKFAGIETEEDPEKASAMLQQLLDNFSKKMGINTAAPGRFNDAMTQIRDMNAALISNSETKSVEKSKEIIKQQAKDLGSAGTTVAYQLKFHKNKFIDKDYAHAEYGKDVSNSTTDLEQLRNVDLLGDGRTYDEVWPNRWDGFMSARRKDRTKRIKAEHEFRKAVAHEEDLQIMDTVIQATKLNPVEAEKSLQILERKRGAPLSSFLRNQVNNAKEELATTEREQLQIEYKHSKLTTSYINSIRHPDVKKEGIALKVKQEEERFGPADLDLKGTYARTAKELVGNTTIGLNGTAFLLNNEFIKQHDRLLKDLGDVQAAYNANLELYNDAVKERDAPNANTDNPYYQITGVNNTIFFPGIQKTRSADPQSFKEVNDYALSKFGADVGKYPYSVETQQDTDITLESAAKGRPIYSPNLMFNVDSLNKANPNKKPIKYSEYFNAMQEGKTRTGGGYHPPITDSESTQFMDALDPVNARLRQRALKFGNPMPAKRGAANVIGNLPMRSSITQSTGMRGLADLVSSGEGVADSMFPSENYPEMLNMDIRTELVAFQKQKLRDGRASAAVGMFQFLKPEVAADLAGLPPGAKFTPENQYKMFVATVFNKPGRENLSAYLRGESDDIEAALDDLANEWSSIAGRDGQTAYKDGVNKASISRDLARTAIMSAREEFTTQ